MAELVISSSCSRFIFYHFRSKLWAVC